MNVARNTVVSLAYTLKDTAGAVLDQSPVGAPMDYLHGHGNIVPGLEAALAGLAVGETFEVTVAPDQGYGDAQAQASRVLPANAFGAVPKVGEQYAMRTQRGRAKPCWIQAVGPEGITVTFDHPLAGETLHFAGRIEAIRGAETAELRNGQPGPSCGCC